MSPYNMPDKNCGLCPRLVEFRQENRKKFPEQFNGAVPSFGPIDAELLVVGLAPGLKGANFTGRPFTGDYAGELLYPCLLKAGFATGQYKADPQDDLTLVNTRITNSVRCVPPQNKPVGQEMTACFPFLIDEIKAMPNLKAILALGGIAHKQVVKAFDGRQTDYKFGHQNQHAFENVRLFDSYHCSRYNVNTGRLSEQMFDNVLEDIKTYLNH